MIPINKLRLAVAVIVLASAIFALIYYHGNLTANAIKEQQEQEYYENWLPENCNCLEKERIKCVDGFELVGNLCRNEAEKTFTNVLKACSKYSCEDEGTTYIFNKENQKWESVEK
ncbi:hypothetical protein HYT25_05030 [Candidatus Pacearchaeota archaeon]|nr:hypothetical protein [Candidatus Pacearchaeota archaeon]